MISNIKIENFQSHKDTSLDFSKGVNVIVGNSDCGKSSIMRALLYCLTNNLQGDAFVSDWAKDKKGKQKEDCKVSIGNITRTKGKDDNAYNLNGTKFEALRGNVPAQIAQAFNIGPINIQRQMDGPFMLSNTPGENAKMINELVNLQDIDEAMTFINAVSRDTTSKLKQAATEKEDVQHQLDRLSPVDQLESILPIIDELSAKGSALDCEAYNLMNSVNEYKNIWMQKSKAAMVVDRINLDELEKLQIKMSMIVVPVTSDYRANQAELQRIGTLPDIEPLGELKTKLDKLKNEVSNLTRTINDSNDVALQISKIAVDLQDCERKLATMVCPLCGRSGENCH